MLRFLKTRGPILLLCAMGLAALLNGACTAGRSVSAASPTPSPSLAVPDARASRSDGPGFAAPTAAAAPSAPANTPSAATGANLPTVAPTPPAGAARAAAAGLPAPAGEAGNVCDPCMVMTISAGGEMLPGDVTARGKEGAIEVLAFDYEVKSPRDVATGQSTGRRQYQPLVVRKPIDKASPLLMKAMMANTPLTVTLGLYRAGADGQPERYYTIEMENVLVSSLSVFGFEPQPLDAAARTFVVPHVLEKSGSIFVSDPYVEDLTLTFGKITVTNEVSKTSAEDSWSGAQ